MTNEFLIREVCKKSGVSFILFLAPYSVASEDSVTNNFSLRKDFRQSLLVLFLAPYSVASEDSALNNFSLRKARDKLELTYRFCHVW